MKISYDAYNRPEPSKIYIAKPNNEIICCLNGIDTNSVHLDLKANNCAELSFDVYRYIDGVETDGYSYLGNLMRLHVDNIGWFIMEEPSVSNDGLKESKHVSASSVDIEFIQDPLIGFKINCGTTDSREMLYDWNVEVIDGVEFAKEQIKFYNPETPELSLVHILIEDNPSWSIGYIDHSLKEYETYKDGEIIKRSVSLRDEIGVFNIDYKSRYAFMTQDIAEYFQCIIYFDIENLTINAYRVETIGEDTNINIAFRNIQNSNDINVSEDIYTVYNVSGGDALDITYWNFGNTKIENLDYYLNTKYMSEELIEKYNAWKEFVESKRQDYADLTQEYNENLDKIAELNNRVPLAGCSTDWATFSDEELASAKSTYLAMKAGYEALYVDEWGNFDIEALDASDDANDYHQIADVILPSIEIEYENRALPTSEDIQPYIETYKTEWKYYGVHELEIQLEMYKEQKATLALQHYDMTFTNYNNLTKQDSSTYPAHSKEIHGAMYAEYQEANRQLNESNTKSCAYALNERKAEVATLESEQDTITLNRTRLVEDIDKNSWVDETLGGFTEKELRLLNSLYNETNYVNENIFITTVDNNTDDVIGAEFELLKDAQESLEIYSQPQYSYSTSLENLLSLYEYKDWSKELSLFNFIYLGVRDDYVVKLRLIGISFNPMTMDSDLRLEFSNMLKSKSKRNDFVSLLGKGNGQTNSAVTSYGTSRNLNDDAYTYLTQGLLEKILNSSELNSKINNTVSSGIITNNINSNYVSAATVDADLINASEINGDNAFIDYVNAHLVVTDEIIARSATIQKLIAKSLTAEEIQADVADIKYLSADFMETDMANIDTANINVATIGELYARSGIIQDLVIQDGTVTGELNGVTIRGDLIEGNTIVADKLVIKGQNGLYYRLNTDGEKIESEQTTENALDGSNIIAKTITASKITVNDLVAFGATIGGFVIDTNAIRSIGKYAADDNYEGVFLGTEVTNRNYSYQFSDYDLGNFNENDYISSYPNNLVLPIQISEDSSERYNYKLTNINVSINDVYRLSYDIVPILQYLYNNAVVDKFSLATKGNCYIWIHPNSISGGVPSSDYNTLKTNLNNEFGVNPFKEEIVGETSVRCLIDPDDILEQLSVETSQSTTYSTQISDVDVSSGENNIIIPLTYTGESSVPMRCYVSSCGFYIADNSVFITDSSASVSNNELTISEIDVSNNDFSSPALLVDFNVTGVLVLTSAGATFGIGSYNGNHIAYDGQTVDLRTDWLKFNQSTHSLEIGEDSNTKVTINPNQFYVDAKVSNNDERMGVYNVEWGTPIYKYPYNEAKVWFAEVAQGETYNYRLSTKPSSETVKLSLLFASSEQYVDFDVITPTEYVFDPNISFTDTFEVKGIDIDPPDGEGEFTVQITLQYNADLLECVFTFDDIYGFNYLEFYCAAKYGVYESETAFSFGANSYTNNNSIAMGNSTRAIGNSSIALGSYDLAYGNHSVAIGFSNRATATDSVAIGAYNEATGGQSVALGQMNRSEGQYSYSEGFFNKATGTGSHAEGESTTASGNDAHSEGYKTKASGNSSHAEGDETTASGNYSHASGRLTVASNVYAYAIGYESVASGSGSFASGYSTEASGIGSYTEGYETKAIGNYSHAEGIGSKARDAGSHAEGYYTDARKPDSHAEGSGTIADGYYSHAQNLGTIANGNSQTVIGKYNVANASTYALIIGNGADDSNRSNALTVDWNGDVAARKLIASQDVTVGGLSLAPTKHVDVASHLTAGSGITIISAYATYNDFFCTVRIRCRKTDSSVFSTGRTQSNPLFTFDASFRPSTDLVFPVVTNNSVGGAMSNYADCYINHSSGNCLADIPTTNTTAKEIQVCLTYAR